MTRNPEREGGKALRCKLGLHRWERESEERLYGDARMVADYRYVDRCTRCGRRSEFWGRVQSLHLQERDTLTAKGS